MNPSPETVAQIEANFTRNNQCGECGGCRLRRIVMEQLAESIAAMQTVKDEASIRSLAEYAIKHAKHLEDEKVAMQCSRRNGGAS